MFRTIMIGIATVVALSAYAPTESFARGGHGGGGGGGFHGGGGGFHGGGFHSGGGGFHGGGFHGSGGFAMGGHGGGMRFATLHGGGFHGGFRHHGRHFRHFAPFAIGFGVPYFYDDYAYSSYPYDDCYRPRHVHTRYGWRWRQLYVCG